MLLIKRKSKRFDPKKEVKDKCSYHTTKKTVLNDWTYSCGLGGWTDRIVIIH